jgi:hypothetical protein
MHLIPLRAKVVKDIKELWKYRWCGHSVLMGKVDAGFQDSKERPVTEARRVLCYIAVLKLGYKCTAVSKALGISAVKVSKAVSPGK